MPRAKAKKAKRRGKVLAAQEAEQIGRSLLVDEHSGGHTSSHERLFVSETWLERVLDFCLGGCGRY